MVGRYVHVFQYKQGWTAILYKDGKDYENFNSLENTWDEALNNINLFLKNGGNKYEYQMGDCQAARTTYAMNLFELEDKPFEPLINFLITEEDFCKQKEETER